MADTVYPGGSIGLYNPEGITGEADSTTAPLHPRTMIGQGALMGWGDELEGWLRSKIGLGTYKTERAKALADVEQFKQKYPVDAAYQEFAGGALPTAVATFFPPARAAVGARNVGALSRLRNALAYQPGQSIIKRGAVVGGVYGGIGGAGGAEPGERGTGALWGAGTGTALGATLPLALTTAGHAGRWLMNEMLPTTERSAQREAERFMLERMSAENVSPGRLSEQAQIDAALGVPSMIAHQVPKITTGVVSHAGTPEAQILEEKLIAQQQGSRQRAKDKLKQFLQPSSYAGKEDELVANLRSNAGQHYKAAYAVGEVNDPVINQALNHPEFKKAFEEAKRISESEALAAKLRGEDPSEYELRKIYRSVETSPGVFEQELTGVAPDVRTLDYMQRGIDSNIERGYRGEGMSSAYARSLKDIRKEVMNRMDAIVPEYKQARKVYGGDADVLDAFHLGRDKFTSPDLEHESITKFFATASDAEKQAFRTGAVRNIWDRIDAGTTPTANAAGKLIHDNKMKERIRAMFDTPEQFNLFSAAMQRDAQIYSGMSKAIEGSNTAPKLAAIENITKTPSKVGGAWKSISSLVNGFLDNSLAVQPEVLNKMAKMLQSGTPAEVAAVVEALEKRARIVRPYEAAKEAATLGTIAGTSGAQTVPVISPETSGGDILVNEAKDAIINSPINPWRPKQEGGSER